MESNDSKNGYHCTMGMNDAIDFHPKTFLWILSYFVSIQNLLKSQFYFQGKEEDIIIKVCPRAYKL